MFLWTQSPGDECGNELSEWCRLVELFTGICWWTQNCTLIVKKGFGVSISTAILDLKKKVINFFVTQNEMLWTGQLLHTDRYKLYHFAVISPYLPNTDLFQFGVNSVTHS
jgi:hypothetical protein